MTFSFININMKMNSRPYKIWNIPNWMKMVATVALTNILPALHWMCTITCEAPADPPKFFLPIFTFFDFLVGNDLWCTQTSLLQVITTHHTEHWHRLFLTPYAHQPLTRICTEGGSVITYDHSCKNRQIIFLKLPLLTFFCLKIKASKKRHDNYAYDLVCIGHIKGLSSSGIDMCGNGTIN